ncbi:hypothetical protein DACRYDRAFT_23006 [Dacryopinax primogenitus]|uniref:HTH La-type RNA-binding domain-containing protein n=1 Tax=Dacryopinax primogenitus (strain DJM 731) TaxID=1858805 RepID=M5FW09_DACPD|nr:uncharacterized protein DACRYDRAFT_23006 [Dacryopinax primogenitus]EJU00549.1 hypothetical protein DACRYDRAFT_23006 [Dacryopinax primogenitus]
MSTEAAPEALKVEAPVAEAPAPEAVPEIKSEEDGPAAAPEVEPEAKTDAAPDVKLEDTAVPSTFVKKVEDMTEEEVKAKILQQVEFYFSEANLPFDKFLFTLSYKDNPEHWVPVGTIASFKRMREYTAAKGTAYVADALKPSTLLELSESGEKVRRKVALENLESRQSHDAFARSIYAKGFGEEAKGLQEELEAFFSQFGKFNVVRMRRDKETKVFKGSVFVEWVDMITASKFLMQEPKPRWKGTELTTMSKKAYCDMKIAEKGIDVTKDPLKRGGRGASVAEGAEGEQKRRADFSGWKLIYQQKKEQKAKVQAEKPDIYIEMDGEKIKLNKDGTVDPAEIEGKYKKGALVAFEGVEGNVPFVEIKDALKDTWSRTYVDYQRGSKMGLVYLGSDSGTSTEQPTQPITEEQMNIVREKMKTIGGKPVTWRHATDEEEKKYYVNRATVMAEKAYRPSHNQHGRGGGGGRGGRGGRGRQNGRGGGHQDRGKGAGSPVKKEASGRPDAVPVIKSALPVPAARLTEPASAVKMDVDAAENGLKRKREKDAGADGSEAKKVKVEEAAAV